MVDYSVNAENKTNLPRSSSCNNSISINVNAFNNATEKDVPKETIPAAAAAHPCVAHCRWQSLIACVAAAIGSE